MTNKEVAKINKREDALKAIKENGLNFQYLKDKYRQDKEIALEAVKCNGAMLGYASEELRDDMDVVLQAISKNGTNLGYASKNMQNKKEVVLKAIETHKLAYTYASEELKKDKDIREKVLGKKQKTTVQDHDKHNNEKILAKRIANGKKIIKDFVSSGQDLKTFKTENGYAENLIRSSLLVIEKYDKELYDDYIKAKTKTDGEVKVKKQKENEPKKLEKDKERLGKALAFLKEYLESPLNKHEFIVENELTSNKFAQKIRVIKELDPKLYEECQQKIKAKEESILELLEKEGNMIMEKSKQPIEMKNGEYRSFDDLDYYEIRQELPEDFYRSLKGRAKPTDEFITIMQKNKKYAKFLDKNIILEGSHIIKNKNGEDITLKREEKEYILDCIKSLGAPLTDRIYKVALDRYLIGELNLKEEKNKTR